MRNEIINGTIIKKGKNNKFIVMHCDFLNDKLWNVNVLISEVMNRFAQNGY